MRAKRTHQMSIYETFAEHEIGQELKAISGWLDRNVNVLDWAQSDIQRAGIKNTGRSGMSIESILRCGLLKQHQQWSYEDLAFHLADSATSTAFARLPRGLYPTDSALQGAIALIRGQTWERTIQRWRSWWAGQFPLTPLWQAECARFMPPVDLRMLPISLTERFTGSIEKSMQLFLRFLSPLTVGYPLTLNEGY